MDAAIKYLTRLVENGGPEPEEYQATYGSIETIMDCKRSGDISEEDLVAIWDSCGDACSPVTMQGFAMRKPHGYAGDFELIDRIYTQYVGPKHVEKWDLFFQNSSGAKAVRNRRDYFVNLMSRLHNKKQQKVLNVGSGPARDVHDFFDKHPHANIHIDCIDLDQNAINHGKRITEKFQDNVTFQKRNIIRFVPITKYDLIWSAGLFDYFSDKVFTFCLKRLLGYLGTDGELVIGNFSTRNPSISYMEFGEWHLNHRSANTLKNLAMESNVSPECISIESEAEGVNLFLHIKP